MLRTILLYIWLPSYLLLSLLYAPIIFLVYIFNKETAIKMSIKLAGGWGRQYIWCTGNKVKVIFKNKESFDKILKEPVVMIANHQSNLDIPLILGHLGKHAGFVAKKEMASWPIIGMWMRNIQCVFLDRSDPRKAIETMKEASEKIKNGYSVVIFPEGTRSENGDIGEFKKGSFKIATDSGVKILPISIKGTWEVLRKNDMKVHKVEAMKLIVDEPVDISTMGRDELKALPEKIKEIIVKNFNEN